MKRLFHFTSRIDQDHIGSSLIIDFDEQINNYVTRMGVDGLKTDLKWDVVEMSQSSVASEGGVIISTSVMVTFSKKRIAAGVAYES